MNGLRAAISSINEESLLPCLNKQILGIECPGCGMQRAVLLLFEGDFSGAFFMYPGLFPMILLVLFLAADQFIKIKYANIISIVLMITTVTFILTNYILKII